MRRALLGPLLLPGVMQQSEGHPCTPPHLRSRSSITLHVPFVTAWPRCNPRSPATAQDPSPRAQLGSRAASVAIKTLTGARSPPQPPWYWQRKTARLTLVPEPARLRRNPPHPHAKNRLLQLLRDLRCSADRCRAWVPAWSSPGHVGREGCSGRTDCPSPSIPHHVGQGAAGQWRGRGAPEMGAGMLGG